MADVAGDPSRMQVTFKAETTRQTVVSYCPVCSMPHEYCEWGTKFPECKRWFEANWKEAFPDVEEEALKALMDGLGFGEPDEAAKKAQKAKKKPDATSAEEVPVQSQGKKKKEKKKELTVELTTRNKKKHITCIRGMEDFEIDPQPAAKLFGKKFACGSAFQKGKNGLPDQIEIQGNCIDGLPQFISEKFGVSLCEILVIAEGNKFKASEAPSS
mmetsp:Transcript_30927/g.51217  ORF Transcript_30927/g.51217 Transcript_30927/m.51217 type:complete len:214 (+) Transcript_30927:42-683(+)|eukprot:CAMPEP_0119311704 /NCGR_PEP_ID=MMETSP1333-20130426/23566_1 /TAXON_ID=418940 /ORGANISM="Scyphosphaera apsteinii, Strain RCC1455" /LENGTH=213 /DNA_ID=CAMNT_0007316163 /DNA_START=38 /DNA_END=679 /DNA_ORIENTATION=-